MKITTRRLISLSSIFGSLDAILSKQFGLTKFAAAMAPLSQQQMQQQPLNVRVATYNVLSSHLSGKDHYSTLNPEHLNPKNRLPVVLQKIDEEIEKSSIICLQEVSHDWAGTFHSHFANKGYHLVTGLYGKKFNGYMGVAIAFKTETFDVLGVDVSRLADKREGGWPRKPREPERNVVSRFAIDSYGFAKTTIKSFLGLLRLYNAPRWPPQDAWQMSENRFNQLVTVQLQDKATQKSFAVGNYHMPCAFYKPQVMTIHTDLAARHVQKLVTSTESESENEEEQPGTATMPYVLAGDWNIKPDGSSYRLLTTGKMDKGEFIVFPFKISIHSFIRVGFCWIGSLRCSFVVDQSPLAHHMFLLCIVSLIHIRGFVCFCCYTISHRMESMNPPIIILSTLTLTP
jgi:exonuclease III